MKVKLLKKLRKRYSILKVTNVTPRGWKSDLGKFDVINNTGELYDWTCGRYDTKEIALERILVYARRNYSKYSVNQEVTKKVWWNEEA